mmetsp:Transcript_5199/g.8202  ORF Transcript_5199/g.8202 Transcript_5199/m.8202 type:complete len:327 (+) Transcript_5199:19-999(+)
MVVRFFLMKIYAIHALSSNNGAFLKQPPTSMMAATTDQKMPAITKQQSGVNLVETMRLTALEELELKPGSKVKIVGLKKFPKYNGQEGHIAEGRDVFWTVSIPSLQGAVVRVRSMNLQIARGGSNSQVKLPGKEKFTEKGLKSKEFLTWITKELAENEPEDPAEFIFDLLKDNLAENHMGILDKKIKTLQADLERFVKEHRFLEAHELKEEIKDLKGKTSSISAIEKQLHEAQKEHNFLLAHDLKEKLNKMINTPSKFTFKRWIQSLYPADRAAFLSLTKGRERSFEWVVSLSTSDLRGAIRDEEIVKRISGNIRELKSHYSESTA